MLQCTVNATSEAWKRMDIWMVETGARHQADGMVLARRFLLGDGDLAQVSPVAEELGGVAAKQPKRLAVVEVRERSIARDVDLGDVDLGHLQHRPHHLACSLTVGIPQQIRQHVGTTCHVTPYLSLNQSHWLGSPSRVSVSQ